ncbi:MAG: hypothetical protein ISR65_07290 [Bacteriovoracaceae bacterium]|nr:hypothetical protein [Bacteriovoracaceae bacterium]
MYYLNKLLFIVITLLILVNSNSYALSTATIDTQIKQNIAIIFAGSLELNTKTAKYDPPAKPRYALLGYIAEIFELPLTLFVRLIFPTYWQNLKNSEKIERITAAVMERVEESSALKELLIEVFSGHDELKAQIATYTSQFLYNNRKWNPIKKKQLMRFKKYLRLQMIKEVTKRKIAKKLELTPDDPAVRRGTTFMLKPLIDCFNKTSVEEGTQGCQRFYERTSYIMAGQVILNYHLEQNLFNQLNQYYFDVLKVGIQHYKQCASSDYYRFIDDLDNKAVKLKKERLPKLEEELLREEFGYYSPFQGYSSEFDDVVEEVLQLAQDQATFEVMQFRKKFDTHKEGIIKRCVLSSLYHSITATMATKLTIDLGPFMAQDAKLKTTKKVVAQFHQCIKNKSEGAFITKISGLSASTDKYQLEQVDVEQFKQDIQGCIAESVINAGEMAFRSKIRSNKELIKSFEGIRPGFRSHKNPMEYLEEVVIRDGYNHCIRLTTNLDPSMCEGHAKVVATKEALLINLKSNAALNFPNLNNSYEGSIVNCFAHITADLDQLIVNPLSAKRTMPVSCLDDYITQCKIQGISEYAYHVTGKKLEAAMRTEDFGLAYHELEDAKLESESCFYNRLTKNRSNPDLFSASFIEKMKNYCSKKITLGVAVTVGHQRVIEAINEELPLSADAILPFDLVRFRRMIRNKSKKRFERCIAGEFYKFDQSSKTISFCENDITKTLMQEIYFAQLKLNIKDILVNPSTSYQKIIYKLFGFTQEVTDTLIKHTETALSICFDKNLKIHDDSNELLTQKGHQCMINSTYYFIERLISYIKINNTKKLKLISLLLDSNNSVEKIMARFNTCLDKTRKNNKDIKGVLEGLTKCTDNWRDYISPSKKPILPVLSTEWIDLQA